MQYKFYVILLIAVFGVTFSLKAQKVGFISSDDIRKNFPEAKQADQRIQSIVEEWKRELQSIEDNIRMLEDEIKKNRLVWTDDERASNENELNELKKLQKTFAKEKFEVGGEYDKAVQMLMSKIEEKIYAATQEVAADEGFDIVFDKSVQPLPYVNFKYDLTVKVLRKLGVDTKKLEEELDAKISKDPRNQQNEPRQAPSKRRSKSRSGTDTEIKDEPVPVQQIENPKENKKEEPIPIKK
ncbi:OmpH family outer membrane protein [Bacteroidetes/Chlorobi group bacterium ChocPot_Mid]|jgi:outer membrane protein|nr:MAG: OmpH family outer membrane protein [Bacteroidetes/Chlorobi group bacterium ChocPot_Mid]